MYYILKNIIKPYSGYKNIKNFLYKDKNIEERKSFGTKSNKQVQKGSFIWIIILGDNSAIFVAEKLIALVSTLIFVWIFIGFFDL